MSTSSGIRNETESDIAAIRRVHQRAFATAGEARLVDQLRDAGRLTISLVALASGEVVGHVALSPITIDGAASGLGLAPVAVEPKHQRSGIGSALVRQALAECRSSDVALVVVLGDPAFYGRFGFRPARKFGLSDTYGDGDAFQAIAWADDRALPQGVVRYAPEFDALE